MNKSGKIGRIYFAVNVIISAIFVFYTMSVLAVFSDGVSAFVGGSTVQCWNYDGNNSGCIEKGAACTWLNNSATPPQNSFCPINSTTFNTTYSIKTGNNLANAGCCSSAGGGTQGCWTLDGNENGCKNDSTCDWKPNNFNQNPWCSNSIGCCQKKGCWSFNGNEAQCATQLNGLCRYVNKTQDPYCPDSSGCCHPKSCSEIQGQSNCTSSQSSIGSSCEWSGTACQQHGGGGFATYNSTGSCMTQGGWWNGTGCQTASSGGGGGFLYAQEARCWFADNKPAVCQNVSGCVYCTNTISQINNASSACYNVASGFCQGHELRNQNWNGSASVNITDINTSSMTCGDIRLKQTCLCGPLPSCVWTNTSTITGNYCSVGVKSDSDRQPCQPPVQFCEDPKAKHNRTLCEDLANTFMMPCKFDNTTGKNCTFNGAACFGTGGGGVFGGSDFTVISSEIQCTAAGGSWKTEYYNDGGSLKQDSWCEKGALFSFTSGQASGNKGNCDSDCWACEFNSTGGSWRNLSDSVVQGQSKSEAQCAGSKKGICKWENDSTAPNGLGWCDYPDELVNFGGSEDCNSECKTCEFASSTKPEAACAGSNAGCVWFNDSNTFKGGYCISSSKKTCSNDCFSCTDQNLCSNSTNHPGMNCSWDSASYFCKPFNFAGEICFNGKDDDSDNKADCLDPDCTYDQFCGGGSIGGGGAGTDCKKILNMTVCASSLAPSGKNCTVLTLPWGGQQYCDFPGSSCWIHDTNISACTPGIGCTWKNLTSTFAFLGTCEINKTIANTCFNSTNFNNQTRCDLETNCQWLSDSYNSAGGRCEFRLFSNCSSRTSISNCCAGGNCIVPGGNCSWRNDSFSYSGGSGGSGGYCEPICFTGLNSTQCVQAGSACALKSSTCEPEMFSGINTGGHTGCHNWDNNYTGCVLQNLTCGWQNFSIGNRSQGICDSKGQQAIFKDIDQSPPQILGFDENDSSPAEIDIRGHGVKDMTDALAFGIVVSNITNAAVCRGYYLMAGGFSAQPILGNGTNQTKFYWYLDTNKNTTDGCNATHQNGSINRGYEFLVKYIISLSNGSVSELKSFHKCSNGVWTLTNVPVSGNRQFMCGMSMPAGPGTNLVGGVLIVIDKESLESFSVYNKSVPMRVLVTSAQNDTTSENSPLDSVASAGYYTQGSVDFQFVDCTNPDTKDEKCKNFQKYGFNLFEDCKNGQDDDGNGLTDCSDIKCSYTPSCASSSFNFSADPNDKLSPSVTFSQVDNLHNSAFIKFDSNDPANGTIQFYGNDSTCSSLNITLGDTGDPTLTYDDYKPFHTIPLELNTLGYDLTNGTKYYYKTTICDPSNNCAFSACLNLTTKTENAYKNFVFKMKLPAGFNVTIPALNYSGNFTTVISGVGYETGIKANASVTRNINVTVNCAGQSLNLVGVDITKPKSIDLSSAFVCDAPNNVLGMNSTSKSWNQLIYDLGMGGYSDYVKLTFPVEYSANNNITWCNDALSNCTNVNSFANCSSGGATKTDCKIPTSLGFSVYRIVLPGAGGAGGSTGGGGGGGGATTGAKTYSISSNQLASGYIQALGVNDKVKFELDDGEHSVSVGGVTDASATITVASHPQTATLSVGQVVKFDLDHDAVDYDLQATLNEIVNASKARITLLRINEIIPVPSQASSDEQPQPVSEPGQGAPPEEAAPAGGAGTGFVSTEEIGSGIGMGGWLILAVIIIVIIAWAVVLVSKKRR